MLSFSELLKIQFEKKSSSTNFFLLITVLEKRWGKVHAEENGGLKVNIGSIYVGGCGGNITCPPYLPKEPLDYVI